MGASQCWWGPITSGAGETNRIARECVERQGGAIKGERFVPLGDVDIGHIIDEIALKRPDFILNTLIGPSSQAFVAAYADLARSDAAFAPEHRPIISCNWTEGEIVALDGKATGHLNVAPYFQSLATPANDAFLITAKRFAPGLRHISAFFAQSYAAVHMIARGIAATGQSGADAVLAHAKRRLMRPRSGRCGSTPKPITRYSRRISDALLQGVSAW